MSYTDNQLIQLAQNNPKELARLLINPNADIRMLTAGVEILGLEVKDETIVLPAIKALLKHMNAAVREGACIGVSSFYTDCCPPTDIMERLKVMSTNDPSNTVRDFAKTLLQDFK